MKAQPKVTVVLFRGLWDDLDKKTVLNDIESVIQQGRDDDEFKLEHPETRLRRALSEHHFRFTERTCQWSDQPDQLARLLEAGHVMYEVPHWSAENYAKGNAPIDPTEYLIAVVSP
jgi:hypothetical protein